MNANQPTPCIFGLWFAILWLHALHQIEESIAFFPWEIAHAANAPRWAVFNLALLPRGMQYSQTLFLIASLLQVGAGVLIAFLFRRNRVATRWLMLAYLGGLAGFLVFHVVSSMALQSPAPVMVTCFGGLYVIPFIAQRVLRLK